MKEKLKKLVFSALMAAFCVIIAWFCKSHFTFGAVRVTFENLPILLTGLVLGPFYGAAVGAAADIVSALLSGYSINPLITLGAAAVGIVAGVFSRYIYNRKNFGRVLLVSFASHAVGTVAIKTTALWLTRMYANEYLMLRFPLYAVIAVIEAYFAYMLLQNSQLTRIGGNKGAKK